MMIVNLRVYDYLGSLGAQHTYADLKWDEGAHQPDGRYDFNKSIDFRVLGHWTLAQCARANKDEEQLRWLARGAFFTPNQWQTGFYGRVQAVQWAKFAFRRMFNRDTDILIEQDTSYIEPALVHYGPAGVRETINTAYSRLQELGYFHMQDYRRSDSRHVIDKILRDHEKYWDLLVAQQTPRHIQQLKYERA